MILSAYRAFVALITFAFVVYLFQGLLVGDTDSYLGLIANNILLGVTVADLYLSLALGCVLISILERKWWIGVILFAVCIPVGGPAVGLYTLWRLPNLLEAAGIKVRPEFAHLHPDDDAEPSEPSESDK